jgi:hypothetical protein
MIARLLFTGMDFTDRNQWVPLAGIAVCILIIGGFQ